MPASQQLPMVSLHSSWKTATIIRVVVRCSNLGSRYIFDIRMDYGAQHMRWEELCVTPQSNGSAHQFASERSGFLTLAQSAWRLFVVPTPNNNAFAGNSRNGRGLIQVSILLALIIEGNINICHPTCYRAVRLRTFLVAIAVLWLALAPERFPLQADTFSCAAGTAGKQKWSLILPSSARVSELTYVTIIGTRYPELDNFQNDIIQFGNYLQAEQCTRGGFVPIFWDAPYSYIHASTDIGEVDWITDKFLVHNKGDLAVLHNRNKMVNAFTNTEWVSGSGGAIISRSVTSCAGMTAFLVLLAQTRVGFLSGGRGKSFHQLPAQEQASQKEEAYARATVALTRAQQICFIMGPLDMQGLVRAATIIGCLKYGASFSGLDDQDDPAFLIRLKDEDLLESPDDSAFLQIEFIRES